MSARIDFRGSKSTSLGVEIELQVLDRHTDDLGPVAPLILEECQRQGIDGVSGEFLMNMFEVKTDICSDTDEVARTLIPKLRRVREIAGQLGYDLALGGTHPFAQATMRSISPDERYQRIKQQQGWAAYQEAIFGLHVHVGVPDGDAAIGVTNLLVPYLPHLLALSANSPFWQGTDTDYASARVRLFRPSASAGIPPHFVSWGAFHTYLDVLHAAGALEGTKDIYWDIRPRPDFGTIEFRVFDAPNTVSRLLGLTALTRLLVEEALDILKRDPSLGRGNPMSYWLANENRWLATRYGLQARAVCEPGGPSRTLAEHSRQLLQRLQPRAVQLGEAKYLRHVRATAETGAERQRRILRETHSLAAVVRDMRDHWADELDTIDCSPTTVSKSRFPRPRALLTAQPLSAGASVASS